MQNPAATFGTKWRVSTFWKLKHLLQIIDKISQLSKLFGWPELDTVFDETAFRTSSWKGCLWNNHCRQSNLLAQHQQQKCHGSSRCIFPLIPFRLATLTVTPSVPLPTKIGLVSNTLVLLNALFSPGAKGPIALIAFSRHSISLSASVWTATSRIKYLAKVPASPVGSFFLKADNYVEFVLNFTSISCDIH